MVVGALEGLGHNDDPACWSWEPPAADAVDRVWEQQAANVRAVLAKKYLEPVVLQEWHQGRCAICGAVERLVEDHDHATGLVRGYLCRSCNVCEGTRPDGIWQRYRERHPALICGIQSPYWDPFLKRYATPQAEDDYDPWGDDNPLRGAGI